MSNFFLKKIIKKLCLYNSFNINTLLMQHSNSFYFLVNANMYVCAYFHPHASICTVDPVSCSSAGALLSICFLAIAKNCSEDCSAASFHR